MTEQMGAIRIAAVGGPEVLRWTAVEVPSPGPEQVLVRVAAAGLNFIDVYHRNGLYPMETPFTPGIEGAGTVELVGSTVTAVAAGDRVAWFGPTGAYAEYAVLPVDRVVAVPAGIDSGVAAAAMLQGMTAHYLVNDTFPLAAGNTCLIHAGAGGVGQLLIQMAKMRGATVFTTVGTEAKAAYAATAGADHVIDYSSRDFAEEVRSVAGDKALDVVYDGVGATTFEAGLGLLRPRGMMVTFGNASGPPPPVDPLTLSQLGSLYLTRPTLYNYVATHDDLVRRADDLFTWIDDGDLKMHIGHRYPLADAADAHRALQGRNTVGKVLLQP